MRLNTPSPSQSSRSSRSPKFPTGGAPASGSSASTSSSTRSRSVEPAALSGSETEREPSAAYSNSSDDQSVTPPSSVSHAPSVLDGRLRRISLPASPSKGKVAASTRSHSPGSSQRTPQKRVSVLSMPDSGAHRQHGHNNVTSTALATVASLRRSPGSSGKKNRQPLPREFRDSRRASSDGRVSCTSNVRMSVNDEHVPGLQGADYAPKAIKGAVYLAYQRYLPIKDVHAACS